MEQCSKTINAGPGHQSSHRCRLADDGHHHHVSETPGFPYEWCDHHYRIVSWSDVPQAFSGFFNESPMCPEGME